MFRLMLSPMRPPNGARLTNVFRCRRMFHSTITKSSEVKTTTPITAAEEKSQIIKPYITRNTQQAGFGIFKIGRYMVCGAVGVLLFNYFSKRRRSDRIEAKFSIPGVINETKVTVILPKKKTDIEGLAEDFERNIERHAKKFERAMEDFSYKVEDFFRKISKK